VGCHWQKPHPGLKRWDSNTFLKILCRIVHWLIVLIRLVVARLKSRRNLLLENLALRHQLLVLHRSSNPHGLLPSTEPCGRGHAWRNPDHASIGSLKSPCNGSARCNLLVAVVFLRRPLRQACRPLILDGHPLARVSCRQPVAANPVGFGTVYKFRTGNVSILSPAWPRISLGLRSSSTVAPKTGQNLLLGLRHGAVPCSTLFQVI